MVSKVFSWHIAGAIVYQANCTHVNRELAFQFYNVNTKNYYVQAISGDPTAHWIQFSPEHFIIEESYFYTSKFRLLPDRYAFLIS
jgi:hypothetical protein